MADVAAALGPRPRMQVVRYALCDMLVSACHSCNSIYEQRFDAQRSDASSSAVTNFWEQWPIGGCVNRVKSSPP